MIIHHVLAICIAYIVDLLIGDPKHWPHPVKWIGSIIVWFDRQWNRGKHRKLKGLYMIFFVIMVVFFVSTVILYFLYQWNVYAGIGVEAVLIATTIAQKGLKEAALEVETPLKSGELAIARKKLSFIVGRDTDRLSEEEIVRATVETVAENTSDGVTAPMFWALIGGAPLAFVYRAINTCDSMVGYKNDMYYTFGWASAKIDDMVNWIPARLTSLLMMISLKPQMTTWKQAFFVLYRDQKKHNSPNSGWGEAAVASLLGIQLGGVNDYQGQLTTAPTMGEPLQALKLKHITQSIQIMSRSTLWMLFLVICIGVIAAYPFCIFV